MGMDYRTQEVIETILDADEQTLAIIQKAINARRQVFANEKELKNLTSLYVGDRVRLVKISPKLYVGMTGSIIGIKDGKYPFEVELDDYPKNRNSRKVNVAATCVEKIE